MAKRNRGGGFLAGVIVGGLAGAALALLLAPQPGERTRRQLLSEPSVLPVRAREAVQDAIGRGRAAAEEARATVREAIEEGKAEAERTRQALYRRYQEQTQGRDS
ncbi:MAG: YtxH domain-containing protein [Chloroflexi bacterium]|nr:YtxH domain-containing protein [Chloroflexota bacterium]